MDRWRRREHLRTVYKELPSRSVLVNAVLTMNVGTLNLYAICMHADKPSHLIPSQKDCSSRKQALHLRLTVWSHEYEGRHIYFVKERNLAHNCIKLFLLFFFLVYDWKVIYLLILVMMQNGSGVYMHLFFMSVNMRLFFCNKSGLNINYSGLNLQSGFLCFCFVASAFQNKNIRICINNG